MLAAEISLNFGSRLTVHFPTLFPTFAMDIRVNERKSIGMILELSTYHIGNIQYIQGNGGKLEKTAFLSLRS